MHLLTVVSSVCLGQVQVVPPSHACVVLGDCVPGSPSVFYSSTLLEQDDSPGPEALPHTMDETESMLGCLLAYISMAG